MLIPCIIKLCNLEKTKKPNPDDSPINSTPSRKYVNFMNTLDTPKSLNSIMSLLLAFIPKLVKL